MVNICTGQTVWCFNLIIMKIHKNLYGYGYRI